MATDKRILPDPRRNRDDWAKKIEVAKRAREAGQAIRADKSSATQPKQRVK